MKILEISLGLSIYDKDLRKERTLFTRLVSLGPFPVFHVMFSSRDLNDRSERAQPCYSEAPSYAFGKL